MVYPVYLCGGQGTRLWPISRENMPKQFIRFGQEHSLLQKTVNRIKTLPHIKESIILTNQSQKYLVEEQLREIDVCDYKIVLEPAPKGTSPAITLAALKIAEKDPNGVMLVLSSDNEVLHPIRFRKLIEKAAEVVRKKGKFLLFASKPSYPETGYGYIKFGEELYRKDDIDIYKIDDFIEKPSEIEAIACIEAGFQWNSGIFLLPVRLYLEEMQMHAPEIYNACVATYAKKHMIYQDEKHFEITYLPHDEFDTSPENSIDYALLEKTSNAAVIKTDIGWSDVGSWKSIYKISKKDSDGNVFNAPKCISMNNTNVQVYSNNSTKLIAALGLKDVTIIDTPDVTMVLDTESSQDVKKVVNMMRMDYPQYIRDTEVHHAWGKHVLVIRKGKFLMKKITVNPGKKYVSRGSSRSKHIMIAKGAATLVNNGVRSKHKDPSSFLIMPNFAYKLINRSETESLEFLKIEF